jgi:chlorite dismutase
MTDMSDTPHRRPSAAVEPSLSPAEGWHCTHLFYRFDRVQLAALGADLVHSGRDDLVAALDPNHSDAPERLQVSITSGHRADFGLMLMDADPLKIDRVHQRLLSGPLGPALQPTYSFVSISEVSEYVPSVEQYAQRLVADGEEPGSPTYEAKVKAYTDREPMMRRQRLKPAFPPYPATCFYPMNKKREVGENWFLLPFDERNQMMAEHAQSGMKFAGRVTQLITVGVGLDDWEWGVTLWAASPEFLSKIVYRMRFDEASARYAQFGPFYAGYVADAQQVLDHCQIGHAQQLSG